MDTIKKARRIYDRYRPTVYVFKETVVVASAIPDPNAVTISGERWDHDKVHISGLDGPAFPRFPRTPPVFFQIGLADELTQVH